VVDIGGGQGSLLAAILAANPGLRGVLFERAAVAEAARLRLAGSAVADRFTAQAGDFFERIAVTADVYLLKKVIHDWTDEQARMLLTRCRAAMPRTARLVIAESLLPDEVRPSATYWLDLLMLVYPGGTERTASEYRTLLASAGFAVTRVIPTGAVVSLIEACPVD
jgi:hypothetical protein